MLYPWPASALDITLSEALEIAMGYLEGTGQAHPYTETQEKAADAILSAWRAGVRHPMRLANCGIVAIEKKQTRQADLGSFYPRVS
jgi:hypothetical protein